jgi:DNA-binding GntR family transcriptional regulator
VEWSASEFVYVQLADDLAARITRGEFPLGSRLPSEAALAEHYGTAKMTVRRAMEILRERGMVRTLHGRGSVVIEVP